MYRVILPFLLLAFAAMPLAAAPAPKASAADVTETIDCPPVVPAPVQESAPDNEHICLDKLKGLAVRLGQFLNLTLDDRKTKSFRDIPEGNCENNICPGPVTYKLMGFYPKHRVYVVRELLNEGENDIIVGMKAGMPSITLSGTAHFSPSGDFVAGVDNGGPMMSSDNSITIVELDAYPIRKVFGLYNEEGWEFVGWEGNNKLNVKTVQNIAPAHPYKAAIVLSDGAWQLHPAYK